MTDKRKQAKQPGRRGRPRGEAVIRPDVPYTMKLPDGRTLYVEVPGRMVEQDRSGQAAFTPEGVRFLDRVRALALPLNTTPRPAYITNLREALGMTQAQFGDAVGVDKMTISRWERGTMRPGDATLANMRKLIGQAKRKGVLLAG